MSIYFMSFVIHILYFLSSHFYHFFLFLSSIFLPFFSYFMSFVMYISYFFLSHHILYHLFLFIFFYFKGVEGKNEVGDNIFHIGKFTPRVERIVGGENFPK